MKTSERNSEPQPAPTYTITDLTTSTDSDHDQNVSISSTCISDFVTAHGDSFSEYPDSDMLSEAMTSLDR